MTPRILLLLLLAAMGVEFSMAQSSISVPLTLPYSTVKGHFAQHRYRRVKKTNQYGKTYYKMEIRSTKHRRNPPPSTTIYAEAAVGPGFNPFLYQAGTAGLNAGCRIYNQHGGVYTQLGAMYDHTLPASAVAQSWYGIPIRANMQIGGFLRSAIFQNSTRRGGMIILDGRLNAQNEVNGEIGLALFGYPSAKWSTVRWGNWNRNAHQVAMRKRPQYTNLPSTLTFNQAVGLEFRYATGFGFEGLMPYRESTHGAYAVMLHSVGYGGRDGWGFIEDLFQQRWFRRELTVGYSHIPRFIDFPNAELSEISTQHTLNVFWIDLSGTVSFGEFYRPLEMTVGGNFRFMDTRRIEMVDDWPTPYYITIPEQMVTGYVRFRLLQHQ